MPRRISICARSANIAKVESRGKVYFNYVNRTQESFGFTAYFQTSLKPADEKVMMQPDRSPETPLNRTENFVPEG